MRLDTRLFFFASISLLATACNAIEPDFGLLQPGPAAVDAGTIVFKRDIRPMMNRDGTNGTPHGCKGCHYPSASMHVGFDLGGLDLETLGALRRGGTHSGDDIVIAGKPEESAIVQKLRGTYFFGAHMPKNGPPFWSDADIGIVAAWIEQGAIGADDE